MSTDTRSTAVRAIDTAVQEINTARDALRECHEAMGRVYGLWGVHGESWLQALQRGEATKRALLKGGQLRILDNDEIAAAGESVPVACGSNRLCLKALDRARAAVIEAERAAAESEQEPTS